MMRPTPAPTAILAQATSRLNSPPGCPAAFASRETIPCSLTDSGWLGITDSVGQQAPLQKKGSTFHYQYLTIRAPAQLTLIKPRAANLSVEQARDWLFLLEQIETGQETSIMTNLSIPGPGGTLLFVPASIGTTSEPIAFLLIKILPQEFRCS